jgi:hypothetical protein
MKSALVMGAAGFGGQGLEVGTIASLTKPVDIKLLLFSLSSQRMEQRIINPRIQLDAMGGSYHPT